MPVPFGCKVSYGNVTLVGQVIQNCYVGRSTYYRMKLGELINVDAYIRLTDYAVLKIRARMERRLLPDGFMKEWRKKIMGVLGL